MERIEDVHSNLLELMNKLSDEVFLKLAVYRSNIGNKDKTIEELTYKIGPLQKKYSAQEKEIRNLEAQLEDVKNTLSQASDKSLELENQKHALLVELARMSERESSLLAENHEINNKYEESQKENDMLVLKMENQIEEIKQNRAAHMQDLVSLTTNLEEIQGVLSIVKAGDSSESNEDSDNNESLDSSESNEDSDNDELLDSSESNKDSDNEESLDSSEFEGRESFQAALESIKEEDFGENLRQESRSIREEQEREMLMLSVDYRQLESEFQKCKGECGENIGHKYKTIEELTDKIGSLRKKYSAHEKDIRNLEAQLEDGKNTVSQASDRSLELEKEDFRKNLRQESRSIKEEYKREIFIQTVLYSELKSEFQKFKVECEMLKEECEENIRNKDETIELLTDKIGSLQKKYSAQEKEIRNLEAQLEDVKNTSSHASDRRFELVDQKCALLVELARMSQREASLLAENHRINNKFEEFQKNHDMLVGLLIEKIEQNSAAGMQGIVSLSADKKRLPSTAEEANLEAMQDQKSALVVELARMSERKASLLAENHEINNKFKKFQKNQEMLFDLLVEKIEQILAARRQDVDSLTADKKRLLSTAEEANLEAIQEEDFRENLRQESRSIREEKEREMLMLSVDYRQLESEFQKCKECEEGSDSISYGINKNSNENSKRHQLLKEIRTSLGLK